MLNVPTVLHLSLYHVSSQCVTQKKRTLEYIYTLILQYLFATDKCFLFNNLLWKGNKTNRWKYYIFVQMYERYCLQWLIWYWADTSSVGTRLSISQQRDTEHSHQEKSSLSKRDLFTSPTNSSSSCLFGAHSSEYLKSRHFDLMLYTVNARLKCGPDMSKSVRCDKTLLSICDNIFNRSLNITKQAYRYEQKCWLTVETYWISRQSFVSRGKSARSRKLSTTTWPIMSWREKRSKS